MKPLHASELLQVWDETASMPLFEKTLLLLGKACSVNDWTQLGRISIGERDARLLQIREWMFGNNINNIANCPVCDEAIEWATDTRQLHLQTIPQSLSVQTFYLQHQQFNIHFRLPDSYDISGYAKDKYSLPVDAGNILANCILDVTGNHGETFTHDVLPLNAWQALEQSMSEQDPQADITMQIACPNCGHNWQAPFDIMSFLWSEINSWVKHVMHEVALLARAFGWCEKDILDLSPQRRQLYIEMLYQ